MSQKFIQKSIRFHEIVKELKSRQAQYLTHLHMNSFNNSKNDEILQGLFVKFRPLQQGVVVNDQAKISTKKISCPFAVKHTAEEDLKIFHDR